MVKHESYVILVAQAAAAALEHVDSHGRGDVIGHSRVHVHQNEVARSEFFLRFGSSHALSCRQNLLSECKFHKNLLWLLHFACKLLYIIDSIRKIVKTFARATTRGNIFGSV